MNTKIELTSLAITEQDFTTILEQDKRVYPTDKPVTREVLRNWYRNNPEFGLMFREKVRRELAGDFVVIPLNEGGWRRLIAGELAEADCDEETIFNNKSDKAIGLHAYHIEKVRNVPGFSRFGLQSLGKVVAGLRAENPDLKVLGISGLAVTKYGENLARRMHFKERDYICDEHVIGRGDERKVISGGELAERLSEGYSHVLRCQMLVLNREDKSVLWDYVK